MNTKGKATLDICKQKLQYLNYSKRTSEIYLHYIDKFINSFDKSPEQITASNFQMYLDTYKFSSISQQNQIINAIRFLYKHGLNRKYDKVSFQRPRKEHKLPKVIDTGLILEAIEKIENKKHKAIISLAFSVGLRVSEVINFKIKDIDSKRMVIYILDSKGKKDRTVPLTEKVLNILRQYYIEYKPKEYLFNGQFQLKYSATSCNQLVKKYIANDAHFHQLRHSCFTNLTDQNIDIRAIQALAGHKNSKTTEIYTHISCARLSSLPLAI